MTEKQKEREIVLTDEQRAIVESSAQRLTVVAAAGSGKTEVIKQRYLHLVTVHGYSADQILAITFTRKAAAEMKKRIVAALVGAGRFEQAQIAETGPIQTLHSFCERVLRENALEAGIDPDFEIAEEQEANRLFDLAFRSAVLEALEKSPEAYDITVRLAGAREFRSAPGPDSTLRRRVYDVLSVIRSSEIDRKRFEEIHRDEKAWTRAWKEAMMADCCLEGEPDQHDWPDAVVKAYRARHAGYKTNLTKALLPEAEHVRATLGLAAIAAETWRRLDELMDERQVFDFACLERLAVDLVRNDPLVQRRIRERFKAVLVDEAQDLNPVQYRLLEALGIENEMLVGDLRQSIYGFRQAEPALFRARLDRGNPKWRGGDDLSQEPGPVESTARRERWENENDLPPPEPESSEADGDEPDANGLTNKVLSRNFRTDPAILEFIRLVPDRSAPEFESDPGGKQEMIRGVEVWQAPGGKDNVAATVAAGIARLMDEKVEPGHIAVLVRKHDEVAKIESRLKARKIPVRTDGGGTFYFHVEIRDFANALEGLVDPDADASLLAVLYSPFAGLSLDSIVLLAAGERPIWRRLRAFEPPVEEDREKLARFLEWFEELSRFADRSTAWELVAELFRRSPYLVEAARHPDARQTLANVRKLLSLAAGQPDLSPREFAERIRFMQKYRLREGNAPLLTESCSEVSILTIHKAKGLEFPIVVFASPGMELEGRAQELEIDRDTGLVALNLKAPNTLPYAWLTAKSKRKDREESMRLLYVALTRCESRLILVQPEVLRYSPVGRWLHDVLRKLQGHPGITYWKPVF